MSENKPNAEIPIARPLDFEPANVNSRKARSKDSKKTRPLLKLGAVLGLAAVMVTGAYTQIGPGAEFLARAAAATDISETEVVKEEVVVYDGDREIPAIVYRPRKGFKRTVLLAHGVHYLGIRDDRFVEFSRRMAEAGCAVVTPDLEDLKCYDLRGRSVKDIEATGRWIMKQDDLMAAAEEWARSQGFASVAVATRVTRDDANAFYAQLGYERAARSHLLRKVINT